MPLFITTQPLPQSVLAGQGATFNVIASGTPPLNYQWRWNGNNLPGATASTFLLASAWATNRGSYSVVVTNGVGVARSLALIDDGTLVAWGANWNGQCNLAGAVGDVAALPAGKSHSPALTAGRLPPALVLSPAVRGGRFSALVQTLHRKHHALEYLNSMSVGDWTTLSTNSGNGALELLTDSAAAVPQRFYRVRQWSPHPECPPAPASVHQRLLCSGRPLAAEASPRLYGHSPTRGVTFGNFLLRRWQNEYESARRYF